MSTLTTIHFDYVFTKKVVCNSYTENGRKTFLTAIFQKMHHNKEKTSYIFFLNSTGKFDLNVTFFSPTAVIKKQFP